MRGPIPGRRRLHDAEFEWRPRTWTQVLINPIKMVQHDCQNIFSHQQLGL